MPPLTVQPAAETQICPRVCSTASWSKSLTVTRSAGMVAGKTTISTKPRTASFKNDLLGIVLMILVEILTNISIFAVAATLLYACTVGPTMVFSVVAEFRLFSGRVGSKTRAWGGFKRVATRTPVKLRHYRFSWASGVIRKGLLARRLSLRVPFVAKELRARHAAACRAPALRGERSSQPASAGRAVPACNRTKRQRNCEMVY